MSHSKTDQLFPGRITDAGLAISIAAALREDYGDSPSAVKEIGLRTGANLRAIRNWFEARHTPSSSHLLTLARSSPSILKLVLQHVGGTDLSEAFYLLVGHRSSHPIQIKNVPINVPIKSRQSDLNERQRWFLIELNSHSKSMARDIAGRWSVTIKTAKRDIADLKSRGMIIYVGSKKNGRYKAVP